MSETTWRKLGLTDREYDQITGQMGREPNLVELNMYSVMWSEHCSYKHSRSSLRLFPTEGPRVVQGPGENAGVVDIGDGWAAVFKIESHNHPSAVEPYQGAATGVGGILRDIFTMGARPVAFLNSLRFGNLDDARVRYLLDGVVAGIGGYGNCVGIPTVAGEIYFESCYQGNPLVNAMCVGVMPLKRLVLGKASGEGNLLLLVGARTGRDGIHGVTFASEELSEASEERRPAVQVGDPFMGKLLLEATLETIERDLVTGVQDLGGAGLTCALTETASRAGSGVEVDLDQVSLREEGMHPFEILTSESQERMLLIVEPEKLESVKEVFKRWGLKPAVLGRVTADGMVTARYKGEEVVRVPAQSVAGGSPVYEPEAKVPEYYSRLSEFDPLKLPEPDNYGEVLLKLLSAPDIASKEWVWRRYDYMVRTSTVQGPGGDSAVIRLRETGKALAMNVDGNGRHCYLDPYLGGMLVVAEATRNLSCSGALPVGITDCLNFGNPEKPEIFWQFRRCVEGMAEACRVLEVPVVGGNVSFYNEVEGEAIYPTPVVGAVGLLEDYRQQGRSYFSGEGDVICLIGSGELSLGGSQYLKTIHEKTAGKPAGIDLQLEKVLQSFLRSLISKKLINSAHDLSDGGLAVAVAESCLAGNCGAEIKLAAGNVPVNELFGEGPSRVLISVPATLFGEVESYCNEMELPLKRLGITGGEVLIIRSGGDIILKLALSDINRAYEEVFSCIME
ncbi:MAG: phosphoribosylformylglycinamidine synthase subunit PurL [Firmicutes bacterium]|nr:phosphoribosylformylglycinamidine synthase subunit PurL [Bacillota bacterium]